MDTTAEPTPDLPANAGVEPVVPTEQVDDSAYRCALRESRIAFLIVVATGIGFAIMFKGLTGSERLAFPYLMFLVVPTLGLQIVVWLMFVRKAQKLSSIEPLRIFLIIPKLLEWMPRNPIVWTVDFGKQFRGWAAALWARRPRIVILPAGVPAPASLQDLVASNHVSPEPLQAAAEIQSEPKIEEADGATDDVPSDAALLSAAPDSDQPAITEPNLPDDVPLAATEPTGGPTVLELTPQVTQLIEAKTNWHEEPLPQEDAPNESTASVDSDNSGAAESDSNKVHTTVLTLGSHDAPGLSGGHRDPASILTLESHNAPGVNGGQHDPGSILTLSDVNAKPVKLKPEPEGFTEIPLPESHGDHGPRDLATEALDQSVNSIGGLSNTDLESAEFHDESLQSGGAYTLASPAPANDQQYSSEDNEPIPVHAEDLSMAQEVFKMFAMTNALEAGIAPVPLEADERCLWMDSTMLYHDVQGKTHGAPLPPGQTPSYNADYVNDGDLILTDRRLLLSSSGEMLMDAALGTITWVDLWKDCGLVIEATGDNSRNVVMVTYPLVYLVYLHSACQMTGITLPVSQRIWRQVEAHASRHAA